MIIINTPQKILNCNIFIKFSWVHDHAPKRAKSLTKGMASLSCGYVQRISLTHANIHFRKNS